MLNLISLIGLLAMIGMAWLMSSHRRQVDWRLVLWGVGLQFSLAALFFNSQQWTFERTFTSFDSLLQACESRQVDPRDVPLVTPSSSEEDGEPFAAWYARWESGDLDRQQLKAAVWPSSQGLVVDVPRFPNGCVFYAVEAFFELIQNSVAAGSEFVFATHPDDGDEPPTHPRALLTTFAFGVLPTVVFFAALMSVLYYLGIMQILIRGMAWLMRMTLRTSASESLAAAANVLVGHTEAALVVRPYVPSMTRSELNALMVGGFATISGSLMAIFASIGISPGHLLTASIISAPAALLIAKVLQPETEQPVNLEGAEQQYAVQSPCNVIEAAAGGAAEGMKLAINIAAMLIAFLALIMFVDICLQTIGGWLGVKLSLSLVFGLLFYPLAWLMGIAPEDCWIAGDLLGKKVVVNEFLAYIELADIPDRMHGPEGISQRSRVILTYALCGFSNFGAIGIQLGGIGPLAPERKSEMARLGMRAMLGGMLAACMTGCVAGVYYGILA